MYPLILLIAAWITISSSYEEQPRQCIYNTTEAFRLQLSKDHFGDLCKAESAYVQQKCNSAGSSTHMCDKCGEKEKLPKFCFCDKKIHCNNGGNGFLHADDDKKTCSQCQAIFTASNFTSRGSCNCSDTHPPEMECECKKGFGGFMCSSILQRVCTLQHDVKVQLPHCNESNEEICILESQELGQPYICNSFNVSGQELIDSDVTLLCSVLIRINMSSYNRTKENNQGNKNTVLASIVPVGSTLPPYVGTGSSFQTGSMIIILVGFFGYISKE